MKANPSRSAMLLVIGLASSVHGAPAHGPDAGSGPIWASIRYATDGTETAYSFSHVLCNVGDEDLNLVASPSTDHPVVGANMYRLSPDGRFEQIGQSWLYHGFCALQLPVACGTCDDPPSGCLARLLSGCADPTNPGTHGSQHWLGPKWEVNAFTGDFPIPWSQGEGTAGAFRRRVRVLNTDLDADLNPGAKYYVERQSVAKDDGAADNRDNNASYRQVLVDPGAFNLTMIGQTIIGIPAIRVWREADPDACLVDARVPNEGLFIVGYGVRKLNDDLWQYEYAIYNMYSHRSGQAFEVPFGPGTTITDIGFHDIDYHSGEAWDSTDWSSTVSNAVRWWTTPFETDEFANALRWGTVYNFRFVASTPPTPGVARLDLFRPGTPSAIHVVVLVPSTPACPLDLDLSGDVGLTDLLKVLVRWGACPTECACLGDVDDSGDVALADLLPVLSAWGPCP